MSATRFVKAAAAAVTAAGLAAATLGGPLGVGASDHLDAPGLASPGDDGRHDVADLYAFQSPSDPDNVVLVATYSPLAGVLSPAEFDHRSAYRLEIDTDGDAVSDRSVVVTFGPAQASGEQRAQVLSVEGNRFPKLMGRTTVGTPTELDGGGTFTAGVYDDPFFFDLNAFLGEEGRSFCDGDEFDFFAGANVTGIVVEIPRASLGTDAIGVWATVDLRGKQVDRVGRPAINTVFIEGDAKNDFNAGDPVDDAEDFGEALGDLAGALLPDILTVDTSSTDGFLNGRLLADDVIDAELQIITGDDTAGDCVDENDVPFLTEFPYLAPAHDIEG